MAEVYAFGLEHYTGGGVGDVTGDLGSGSAVLLYLCGVEQVA